MYTGVNEPFTISSPAIAGPKAAPSVCIAGTKVEYRPVLSARVASAMRYGEPRFHASANNMTPAKKIFSVPPIHNTQTELIDRVTATMNGCVLPKRRPT